MTSFDAMLRNECMTRMIGLLRQWVIMASVNLVFKSYTKMGVSMVLKRILYIFSSPEVAKSS